MQAQAAARAPRQLPARHPRPRPAHEPRSRDRGPDPAPRAVPRPLRAARARRRRGAAPARSRPERRGRRPRRPGGLAAGRGWSRRRSWPPPRATSRNTNVAFTVRGIADGRPDRGHGHPGGFGRHPQAGREQRGAAPRGDDRPVLRPADDRRRRPGPRDRPLRRGADRRGHDPAHAARRQDAARERGHAPGGRDRGRRLGARQLRAAGAGPLHPRRTRCWFSPARRRRSIATTSSSRIYNVSAPRSSSSAAAASAGPPRRALAQARASTTGSSSCCPSAFRIDPEQYIVGNAADLDVLKQAGIDEAPTVIVTTHDDDLNVYLTIYCRRLRPDIQIISRATEERNVADPAPSGRRHRHVVRLDRAPAA